MHPEILTPEQQQLLPMFQQFSDSFGLVGGTGVALQIGHRRSIDFDMFSLVEFDNNKLREGIRAFFPIEKEIVNRPGEYTIIVLGVKITFYYYRFLIDFPILFEGMRMADLLTIAAMKVHAIGQRAKWKDYVDLYYILKNHHTVNEISKKSQEIFKGEFSERLFRIRLAYFYDIKYNERVEFMPGFVQSPPDIKAALTDYSLDK